MSRSLPRHPGAAAQVLDASLHLLDRQVVDRDGEPVSFVADVELDDEGDLTVCHLVAGSGLLERLFGGHTPKQELHRIPWDHVADIGVTVRLGVSASELELTWPEDWVRERIVSRIPGGSDAPV